jgi:hypothetical protein
MAKPRLMAKPRSMSNFSRENSMGLGLSFKSMPILIFLTADAIFSTEMHGLNQKKSPIGRTIGMKKSG